MTSPIRSARLIGVLLSLLMLCCCATLPACDEKAGADTAKVTIAGKVFHLELALTEKKRFRGLSERTHIDPTGGLLFVFPEERFPRGQGFVMRDCPIGIDIVYLDGRGRVVTQYEMVPEPPRGAGEGKAGEEESMQDTPEQRKYNERLKQYVSRAPYKYVIELAGGTLKTLNLKEGDQVTFDMKGLDKRAQ